MSNKDNDTILVEGEITHLFPNTLFQVKLDIGEEILCHLCGKMRKMYIKLAIGDRVRVEISKYDPSRGKIVYRLSGTTFHKRPYRKK